MKKRKQNTQSIIQAIAAGTALLQVLAVSLVTLGFVLSANANERRTAIITFDAPGAGTGPLQGTRGLAISPDGTITGLYFDSGNVVHGYVRARDGTFITFDAPGAGTGSEQGTGGESINPAGTITGIYDDANGLTHGFVRASTNLIGVIITTIDAPGALLTFALNINPAGAIAGYYLDANRVWHGFVRTPKGAITTFDAPGAGTGPFQGTLTAATDGLNPAGAIAGYYLDANSVAHGLVRAADGAITTFDAPDAGTGPGLGQGTLAQGISVRGTITGNYVDASNVNHGFVRARDGAITTFDVPGAGTGRSQGTLPKGISARGTITGNYFDASSVAHGFVRARDGAITTFDAPGAGTGPAQGTFPSMPNPPGAIVGDYLDASNVFHGFLRRGD